MEKERTVDDEIAYNNYKLTADKILQLLSQIREDPSASAKRWVWELLQNAKDVPNRYGKVSVEIELISDELLEFRHNGDTFSTKNITGLVQQVSSKDSQNLEGQTGKFGTGFICTHLLSDIIDVSGIVTYKGKNRKFKITLDRSGYRSEDLLPRIESTLEDLRDIENKYTIVDNYEENRTESSFDTIFTYHLTTDEKRESAKAGLKDLINTLPITLVTQSNKIKQVRVINRLDNTDVVYTCDSKGLGNNVQLSKIKIDDVTKIYLSYITEDVALTTEVEANDNFYKLIKRDSKQPVLYRDFPLIGSEKFYFPYTLNGFRFNPAERRNGLLLNSADHPSCIQNREIVEKAVQAVLNFNEWLIQHNATNKYLLASSRIPESPEKYSENVAAPWIKQLQKDWRKELLSQELVETDDKSYSLKDLSVPSFSSTATKETNETFYDLLEGQYIGRGILPKKEHLHGWLDVIRPEYDTWESELKYDKDDFLSDLSAQKTLEALCLKINKNKTDTICWLNKVYKFLIDQNLLIDFDKYTIIPNQNGNFQFLKDLKSDHSAIIPEVLKSIYNEVNEVSNYIQNTLMDNDVDAEVFGNSLMTFSLKEIITTLNEYIKNGSTIIKEGKVIDIKEKVAFRILTLYPQNSEISFTERRLSIYNFYAAYQNMPPREVIEVTDLDLWKDADIYWFKNCFNGIKAAQNVNNFASSFFITERTVDSALDWLNSLLKFYRDNSYGDLIQGQAVFPNQLLDFKVLNELRFDKDIPEEFKDLANVAGNTTNPIDVYRHQLLHKSIHGYEQQNPLDIKDIYEFVNKKYKEGNDNIQDIIANNAVAIIPKSPNGDEPELKLYNFAKTLFSEVIPSMKYVELYSGFNWGFVQEHIIKKICKVTCESINITGLKNLSLDFKDKTNLQIIHWVDNLIKFIYDFKNKKYWSIITDVENGYGIWLNQNNDFCKFQDVRLDDSVPEGLKEIAATNPHVNYDYHEVMFTLDSTCGTYFSTDKITLKEVAEFIDSKISSYKGDKQDKDFAALVFNIGKLSSSIPGLLIYMQYYANNKNALIVGSLGEGDTLDLVGSIVQQGDDKLRIVKNILDKSSIKELDRLSSLLEKYSTDEVERLLKDTNKDSDVKATSPTDVASSHSPLNFNVTTKSGNSIPMEISYDDSPYGGLSYEQMHAYLLEAKQMVREKLEPKGYVFTQGLCENSYSSIFGVMKDGHEIPLVVHSYLSTSRPFALNAFDWDQLKDNRSQLWIRTKGYGVQCVPFYALPQDNHTIGVTFRTSNLDKKDRYIALAEVLRYFKGLQFNFGSTIPYCGSSPKCFNNPTKELEKALSIEDYVSKEKVIEEELTADDESLLN